MYSYAIDFGTSNTLIARWNPASQEAEVVSLPGLSTGVGEVAALIPSLLYVEDAVKPTLWMGQQVRDRGLDHRGDRRLFQRFKRGIGANVQGYLPELDQQTLTFEQVGAWFLGGVIQQLQSSHGDGGRSLILTVPVDSFEAYRAWLGQVAQGLSVDQIRLLDEPTAAALGYGLGDGELLLVLDFGGGTLDLSLVQLQAQSGGAKPLGFILKWGDRQWTDSQQQPIKTARVIAKAGLTLGGTDIDHWIVDYFQQQDSLPANEFPLSLRLAERLKITLSQQTQSQEIYFDETTFTSLDLTLGRSQLEEILREHQFFNRLDDCLTQVLQQARRQGITPADIEAVLLVGGSSQIPAVQTWLKTYFPEEKLAYRRPFTAIAMGALQLDQGMELQDFLYHSYGVRYWDRRRNRHNWHQIIPAGQAYPMAEPIELVLGASTDSQPTIELVIGELGQNSSGTEIFFDGDRLITRSTPADTHVQALNDTDQGRTLAPLDPPGYPGSDRLRVLFQVDRDRQLRITVEDLFTLERLVDQQPVIQLR
ncbi:Hsp70 family protein [Candidatus Synechococcus calcipolaris G9]|uniref:Hsp70 family protein n=1 Tax=Candidatus Synechococcus calcipolaris G9 TaxID=1497997 RepID=A0ABT6EWJ0_9SYNE|nr:Hsp70 family protein [Candidatus Synechococcus calcipolaris]MDG2990118.1 Hsp70 family protein [Candidatus Synechococcus calcipolaris G9]